MTPTIVTLDFESYWSSKVKYSLSKMGPIEYIKDPRFLAQMLSVRIDHGETQVYEYDEIAPALATLHLDDPDVVTVGHRKDGISNLPHVVSKSTFMIMASSITDALMAS